MKSTPALAAPPLIANTSLLRRSARLLKYGVWHCARLATFRHRKPKFPVCILYLTAEKSRYPQTRGFVEQYREWLGTDYCSLICIDNYSVDPTPHQIASGVWEVGGDNTYWEFSGWKRGLAILGELSLQPMVVIFVNDACLNHGNRDPLFYRMRFNWNALRMALSKPVGCLDHSSGKHVFFGSDVSTFVRSNFFALPLTVAQTLDWTFLSEEWINKMMPTKYSGIVLDCSNDLNAAFHDFSIQWITSRWHRSEKPTAHNWPILRSKLIACFNERLLTATLRKRGIPIVDANRVSWL